MSNWVCINCSCNLGNVYGNELYPSIDGKYLHTSGPNLVVTCPTCGNKKTFYTADPVVRAVYQLIQAVSDAAAKAMIDSIGSEMHKK